MPATVHLVLGPPGADRTARLAAAFREAAAGGFGAALFLAPTRRHADQVRARLAGSPGLLAPSVWDVQAFAEAASLLAAGITAWLVGQAILNIGAVIGLLPVTGVPLPFVSYGGTSLVIAMGSVGVLLNIARQSRPLTKKTRG